MGSRFEEYQVGECGTWKVPLLPALLIQTSTEPIWEAAALIRRCTLAGLLTSHSMPATQAIPPTCWKNIRL